VSKGTYAKIIALKTKRSDKKKACSEQTEQALKKI
jgi:hypothetical protein